MIRHSWVSQLEIQGLLTKSGRLLNQRCGRIHSKHRTVSFFPALLTMEFPVKEMRGAKRGNELTMPVSALRS
jgi:hypothetical protein